MIELLSPAGSMEALQAAVQNGADAVYLGCGSFNARAGAKNFTIEELRQAVSYCHIRGVAVHLTVNTLTTDREAPKVAELIGKAARAGVDAFIVQDPGTVKLCRRIAPMVSVHASTQMGIHNLDGVRRAAKMGCSRVVLARELSRENIAYICKNSPVEIEVFAHGALCMCYSGQCYFSSVVGRRSGNRGQCAQPCRLPYGYGRQENRYPLSLRDNCLIEYMEELERIGVTSLKLEGRMKRPEYVAVVTRIYRSAMTDGHVTEQNARELEAVFSRQGFTQGYYQGKIGKNMFGTRQDIPTDKNLLAQARATYSTGELPRVGILFYAMIKAGQPSRLAAEDPQGRRCLTTGPVPEQARTRPMTAEDVAERLHKTGGTPYFCKDVKAAVDAGLVLSAAAINDMRRRVLDELTAVRGRLPEVELCPYQPLTPVEGTKKAPDFTVSLRHIGQITGKLISLRPSVLYIPATELLRHREVLEHIPGETTVCPVLPRVIWDTERPRMEQTLETLKSMGVGEILCGNPGHVEMVQSMGLTARGDFGLNVFNSAAAEYWQEEGLRSLTVSFEATLPQIRDMSKPLPVEMIAYGRLPLMLTENCLIRHRSEVCACEGAITKLTDRRGEEFPVLPDPGTCRSVIYNGKKLWLLDKPEELKKLGLWAIRLSFTTEDAREVDQVLMQYKKAGTFDAGAYTRGLYYRGVE